MNNGLSDLHKRLLHILSWYHSFCVEHNLNYYLLGGTMLGAARHQGFIPWDDDIDVGMPRKDYEKFLELTKNKNFGDFVVEGIDTEKKDFYYGYAKIYDTKSTLIENNRYKIKRGIFLDLFPLDGVANDKNEIQPYYSSIQKKQRFLFTKTCGIRKGRKWYKNLAIYVGRLIPNFIVNSKKLMLSIDDTCKARAYDDYLYVGNLYGNWGIKEIVERSVMSPPKLYKFEDLEVYGVADYDKYLTSLYGDWRKLPPKEKQVTHHDYIELDLNKSYLEKDE